MTDDDLALLRFEKLHWHHRGAKATAIRERFGMSETAYWQRVRAITQQPAALAAEPVLVNRLRRRWR